MERDAYLQMASTEDTHWWFVARRRILHEVVKRLLQRAGLDSDEARILEVGAGTGGNLGWLSSCGRLTAVEMDDGARALARSKSGIDVLPGALPDDLPMWSAPFDLIVMFDVLEHVDADGAALESLSSLLAPGGVLLLTVPAHPWLWSRHDEFLHHRRRYTRRALEEVLQASGLNVVSLGYFNTLLFPLALIGRLTDQLMGRRLPVGSRIPTAVLNAALTRIFAFERLVVPSYFLPFGLSLIAVAGREREA